AAPAGLVADGGARADGPLGRRRGPAASGNGGLRLLRPDQLCRRLPLRPARSGAPGGPDRRTQRRSRLCARRGEGGRPVPAQGRPDGATVSRVHRSAAADEDRRAGFVDPSLRLPAGRSRGATCRLSGRTGTSTARQPARRAAARRVGHRVGARRTDQDLPCLRAGNAPFLDPGVSGRRCPAFPGGLRISIGHRRSAPEPLRTVDGDHLRHHAGRPSVPGHPVWRRRGRAAVRHPARRSSAPGPSPAERRTGARTGAGPGPPAGAPRPAIGIPAMREGKRLVQPMAEEIQRIIYAQRLPSERANCFAQLSAVNMAHLVMLAETGILEPRVAATLARATLEIDAAGPDAMSWDAAREDAYYNYEARLVELVGIEAGGRIHAGRSRNDI